MTSEPEQQPQVPKKQSGTHSVFFSLISVTLYVVLALFFVGKRPYFHDEASTWFFASDGIGNLFDALGNDVHPPLYFLISWVILQSGKLMALRLFSVLCTAIAIGLISWRITNRFGKSGQLMSLIIATSPFLIFVGCFARYYGLVLLEFALLAVAIEAVWNGRLDRKTVWKVGVIAAAILMTNYVAALLILPPVFLALMIFLKRGKKLRLFWESLVPCIVGFAIWSPWFLTQLGDGFDGRTGGFAISEFIKSLIRNTGYLGYSFFASDGLPPWNKIGWVAGIIGALATLVAVAFGIGDKTTRRQCIALVAWLLAVSVFGGIAMPGSAFIFYPVRVAWSFFLWAFLILILIKNRPKLELPMIWALGFMNGLALQGLVWENNSTNWAYGVPHERIGDVMESELLQDPEMALYLDVSSFIQVRYELEIRDLDATLNDCAADQTNAILVLNAVSDAEWPLSDAVGLDEQCNPAGDWELVSEELFVAEDPAGLAMKEKVMGRTVEPYKLSLRKYQRVSN